MIKNIVEKLFFWNSLTIDSYVLFFVVCSIILAMLILSEVFYSLAFYRFMKSRNLKKTFWAWIPFYASRVIGMLYDDITNQGKETYFGTVLNILSTCFFVTLFIPFTYLPFKLFILLALYFSIIDKELKCYKLILKEYAPNSPSYFTLTKIFMIMPIIPFIPALCLLRASKNQPAYEMKV